VEEHKSGTAYIAVSMIAGSETATYVSGALEVPLEELLVPIGLSSTERLKY
jgi:hypothetical protein